MKNPRNGKPMDYPLAPVLEKYLEEGDHSAFSVKESSGGSSSAVNRWKLGKADVQAHSIYNICHFHADHQLGLAILRTLGGEKFEINTTTGAIVDEDGNGKIDLKDAACKGTRAAKESLGVVEKICRIDSRGNKSLTDGQMLDCLSAVEAAKRELGQMERIILEQMHTAATMRGRS